MQIQISPQHSTSPGKSQIVDGGLNPDVINERLKALLGILDRHINYLFTPVKTICTNIVAEVCLSRCCIS